MMKIITLHPKTFKQKTWTFLRKRKLNRKTELSIIAAQNEAVRTNNIKI